jgi:hypothetical protein
MLDNSVPRGTRSEDSADSYTRVQRSNNMTDRSSKQAIDGHHDSYTTEAGRIGGRGHSYVGPVRPVDDPSA